MKSLPQGPELSVEQQTFLWFSKPYEFMDQCAKEYGKTFTLRISGWDPMVLFSDPEDIREIFHGDPAEFHAGRGHAILAPYIGSNGLLVIDGARHLAMRKMMLPPFRAQRMSLYGTLIREITLSSISAWKDGKILSIHRTMLNISLEVIFQAVLGLGQESQHELMKKLAADIIHISSTSTDLYGPPNENPGRWDPKSRLAKISEAFNQPFLDEIAKRRQNKKERYDILSLLLEARDDEGNCLTNIELRDQVMTLLLAGHETTATALTWALHWLEKTPEALFRLEQEILSVEKDPQVDTITQLEYLQAVCLETLRITPVVPVVLRCLQKPRAVAGFSFEAGTYLTPCIYLAHHNPSVYQDSKSFLPERFLHKKFSAYEFFPFGGGIRRCVGMGFSLYEMKIVLFTLLQNFSFEAANRKPIRPVRRSVTVGPSEGGRMRVSIRKPSFVRS